MKFRAREGRGNFCQLPSPALGGLQTATGPSCIPTALTGTGSMSEYDPAYHELMLTPRCP